MLLDYGADPNVLCASGDTALSYAVAARSNGLEMARLLLIRGAFADQTGCLGRTPLLAAVKRGNIDMVKLLLEFRANPRQQEIRGQSPMSLVIQPGKHEIVGMFHQFGHMYGYYHYGYHRRQDMRAMVAGGASLGFVIGGLLDNFNF
jgi:ankyrin repeat protein